MLNENISAISTAHGTGGVAIIRISGENPLSVAQKMFVPTGRTAVADFAPNLMYTGKIICGGFEDFGMCVYFKAPRSFTGEDVVEFHCHGGVQIARGVFKATLANGARAAEGGEFTKRAFLNGKLSLSSAEGMIDMINAESLAEIRAGSMLYAERLSREVKDIQSALTDMLAGIAADIDYPEEDVASTDLKDIKRDLNLVADRVRKLSESYGCGRMIKQGVTVALCGKPNVGKSSLLNSLLGFDKAIVTPQAGTTRDAVEGCIEIDGIKYNFIDTAGIRECADEIERMGIDRAKKILASADVVLLVSDDGNFDTELLVGAVGKVIKVFNKCDISLPQTENFDVKTSAKTGEGIELLKAAIMEKSLGAKASDGAYVIEERHYLALNRALQSLENALRSLDVYPLDLISLDVNAAWSALGEITGETATEEIIDTVFKKFCVGK